jgi:SAM-dependent methyltransferase
VTNTTQQHPPPGPRASSWSRPETVEAFAKGGPNRVLVEYVEQERARGPLRRVLDIGCGAARNALPLARAGVEVLGLDDAMPMVSAARERLHAEGGGTGLRLVCARMDALPLATRSCDLIIAHGIWNLARSGAEFRAAVREAARVACPGAGLFLFTFSRHTLAPAAAPVPGETFVFTQFSGEPQCFLTEQEIVAELAAAGFERDPAGPLTEYNRPPGPALVAAGPVIYEGTFRRGPG